ncbi:hypothetical protein SAMN04487965_2178 [Microbulbifer donghaiensis]|uniref:MetA-pathway of phenol degradation n=1 Tax=Microbulbifer donghaiensis TaxID=494016 RepID=A0A1M5CFI3_9GAMM|nr:hypothetical protein [Microbulbifer donghaiensis]SHF53450.1 hypothetical protein SAMN04487965_2178 [Microbulbifer donghaiensis]
MKKHCSGAGILACALLAAPALAQPPEMIEPSIHWAYATFFGTGWYKVSDESSAYIVHAAPRWILGATGADNPDDLDVTYRLQVPLTVGVAKFDFNDIPGLIDPNNLKIASAGLSLDADISLTPRFSIRPAIQTGYGNVINDSEHAWTYATEIRSRYKFESGRLDWAILANLGYVGYDANEGDSDDFAFAALGSEFAYPVNWLSRPDNQSMFYWHLSYIDFLDKVRVRSGVDRFDSVASYWQVGAAIGRREKPICIGFLKFDRLGLAYNYSATGELRGVKLVFRSLYDL